MITNLLTHNPYRILGVYSNSPKKDVLSNLNKMKAFLKVGKTVSFPLDLPTFLPVLNRDESIASSAQASIELPMDQIKHTLFWFMKATTLDEVALNHLLSGNITQAKEIWNKKEDVSSLLNLMACAMIEGDSDTLAIKADTLFQKHSGDFCFAVNETIKLTSSQLTELFVEELKKDGSFDIARMMQAPGASVEWRNITGGGLVKPIIEKITLAITEAKLAWEGIANYRAGEKLISSTKELLSQLRSILNTSDLQYQMIADKLAMTILQCGINYFNKTEEDDASDKAIRLHEYALSIAAGQLAKDRCKENVDILKKIGPGHKVRKEINRIRENLNVFSGKSKRLEIPFSESFSGGGHNLSLLNFTILSKYRSFAEINGLIEDCKPDLLSVRQKLGASNSLYLKISSAVASAAINALVKKINDAQVTSIASDTDSLKRDVSSAISTMSKISSLDMTTECRNYFNSNNSTLNNINSQLNPSGGCYIATMAYGDYDHPQVMVLRQFRDSYLSNRGWGRKFINFYYANSPHWVEVLKSHRHTNVLIRKVLDSFVYLWKKTSHYE